MRINRLSEALGAEVTGVDVAALDTKTFETIHTAFLEHQLLVFRGQSLAPDNLVAFSARFGPIETRPDRPFTLEGVPEVSVLSNRRVKGEPVGIISAGDFWHTDLSFGEIPSRATFLHALEVAEEGGDTEWSNMYRAYETLPEATKSRIEGLKGVHVFDRRKNPRIQVHDQFREKADAVYGLPIPDAVHPIVRTHAHTGRKSLFVSPRFVVGIDGMEDDEAQPLLDELFEHQIRPEFRYRHKWRQGDLLMWDNSCLIHIGLGGIEPPGIRHMHRSMVLGDRPC
ncbi:MAG: TauD/TfdA family dioxygenase [Rhodospirillaceae bacterium]|jgi:taurine dioxygenase|nr:TauD/TfdA family dioxygenase [Rhodospirillaceae bacterium]MBT5459231.1 TauD/TfdA family dioxygenase [Rhodospirillaceae bacterium]